MLKPELLPNDEKKSYFNRLQFGVESRYKVSRFTLMPTDTKILQIYKTKMSQFLNKNFILASIMLITALSWSVVFAAIYQDANCLTDLSFNAARCLLVIPSWYLMRRTEKYQLYTPWLLVVIFYLICM